MTRIRSNCAQCIRRVGRRGLVGALAAESYSSSRMSFNDQRLLPIMLALRTGNVDLVIGN
jgi:hypothetical protein